MRKKRIQTIFLSSVLLFSTMGTALAASKSRRTECIWLHSKASVTGTYTNAMIRDSFSYTMTVMGMDSDLKNSGTSVHIEWAAYGYGYIGFRYKLLKDGSNKLEKNGTISSSKGFSTNSCYVCVKLSYMDVGGNTIRSSYKEAWLDK